MSFKWGVYGEKEVRLGLSRPLDGLACYIKLLPVRIALILAYFGGSRYDVVLDLLSCLSFRDPAKVMRYHGRYYKPRSSIDDADGNLTHLETPDNPLPK